MFPAPQRMTHNGKTEAVENAENSRAKGQQSAYNADGG